MEEYGNGWITEHSEILTTSSLICRTASSRGCFQELGSEHERQYGSDPNLARLLEQMHCSCIAEDAQSNSEIYNPFLGILVCTARLPYSLLRLGTKSISGLASLK
ncbi:hypothetical protein RRG08_044321 [Elysia crispata]|uniref:Uncharacterized protein n=1 Tax=Elysia crispata TaxID=231223 RepID=A0AAE0ZB90_9GAST|nr:hypothetical protein RRG08_044321 [Elysia crispata]